MMMRTEIPLEEWEDVTRRVLPFTGDDEASWFGHVALFTDGERRNWIGTDSYRLAALQGGLDRETYELLLPARAFAAATGFGRAVGAPIELRSSTRRPDGWIEVRCGAASLRLPQGPPNVSTAREVLLEQLAAPRHRALLDTAEFTEALATARLMPSNALHDDRPAPLCHLRIGPETASISVDWGDYGFTEVELPARGDALADAAISPRLLAELLEMVALDEVTLALPHQPHASVQLSSGEWTGLLMPIDTTVETIRPRVDEVLARVFGDDVVHRDHDGDYCLSTRGVPVFARLAEGEPAVLHVFAVALDGVEATAELLGELNEQNARTRFVRLIAIERQVLVEADLVASSLDDIEIQASFERVREVANEIAPLMAMAFGGNVIAPSEELRRHRYLDTVVTAELSPGAAVRLAGPDAVETWPFDGPVHVISAANPHGRRIPDGDNVVELGNLARSLTLEGIGYVRASGEASDGTWGEDSLLVWSIERDQARWFGRQFGQEAIFELTTDELRVIECFGDDVLPQARRPTLTAGADGSTT